MWASHAYRTSRMVGTLPLLSVSKTSPTSTVLYLSSRGRLKVHHEDCLQSGKLSVRLGIEA